MIGEIFGLMAALSWAVGSIFDRIGLRRIPPLLANTMRSIPSAIFTFILMVVFEGPESFISVPVLDLLFIVSGTTLALVIGDYLFLYSLRRLGVSKTMPIVSIYPVFALSGAFFLLAENITIFIIIGTLLVICGIYLLSRSRNNKKDEAASRKYILMIPIMAALMWGLSQVFFTLALINVPPFTMTTIRLFYFSSLLTGINLVSGERRFYKNYSSYWGKMSTIGGFFSLAIGGLFLMLGLSYVGVAKTSPLTSITPLFSTILAVFLLKEKVDHNIALGTVLIVIGVIIITVL